MSTTTYITRKEETSWDVDTKERCVRETIIWTEDSNENDALLFSELTGGSDRGYVSLDTLMDIAEDRDDKSLSCVLRDELRREGLDETDYEVELSY